MLPEEIDALLAGPGLPSYRSAQVVEWLFRHSARSFDEMTNLPKNLRTQFAEAYSITDLKVLKAQISEIDKTKKLLLGLNDDAEVETVMLPEGKRGTVCISTQLGCAFGCPFCASGKNGLTRNLSVGEIIDQARRARSDPDIGDLTNIVLMGMGEPLANYDATVKAVRIFLHERGFALGKRRVTISTAGYLPGLERLAEDDLPVRLALSLHATDNATRNRLMPINRKYPIERVLEACKHLHIRRRTPLTIEYMLIEGQNDSLAEARRLAGISQSLKAKVNLIPWNQIPSSRFKAPSEERILRFQAELRKAVVLAFIRRSRGADIEAACGQLRASDRKGKH